MTSNDWFTCCPLRLTHATTATTATATATPWQQSFCLQSKSFRGDGSFSIVGGGAGGTRRAYECWRSVIVSCCHLRWLIRLSGVKYISWALLFIIIIITLSHLYCFSTAFTVSAGSYITLPDHQPLQLCVAVATVLSLSAPSIPIGISPPAVTCRKISTPVCTHTQTQPLVPSQMVVIQNFRTMWTCQWTVIHFSSVEFHLQQEMRSLERTLCDFQKKIRIN